MLPTNASKFKKAKVTKKLKVTEVSQEDPLSSAVQDKNEAAAVKDYHFLAGAMGMASDTGEDEEKEILLSIKVILPALHSSVLEVEMEINRWTIWMRQASFLTACAPVTTL